MQVSIIFCFRIAILFLCPCRKLHQSLTWFLIHSLGIIFLDIPIRLMAVGSAASLWMCYLTSWCCWFQGEHVRQFIDEELSENLTESDKNSPVGLICPTSFHNKPSPCWTYFAISGRPEVSLAICLRPLLSKYFVTIHLPWCGCGCLMVSDAAFIAV